VKQIRLILRYTIMSSAKRTSKRPSLGLNIKEASIIITSRVVKFESRDIPLRTIVSGVGRGKTHYLVERQKELRKTACVLCKSRSIVIGMMSNAR